MVLGGIISEIHGSQCWCWRSKWFVVVILAKEMVLSNSIDGMVAK